VHGVVKSQKPHTTAEKLLLPAAIDLASAMIGAAQQLNLVPLSNDTMCRRIGDMAEARGFSITDRIFIEKAEKS